MRVRTLAVLAGVRLGGRAAALEPPRCAAARPRPPASHSRAQPRSPGAEDIRYGFEGGRVVKVRGTYHLFTSEMVGDPIWVKMRLGHWTSSDRLEWKRAGTVAESSGEFEGKDPRASLWSPLPVWDAARTLEPLLRRVPLGPQRRHALPPEPRRRDLARRLAHARAEGIRGPFEDVGVVMRPGPDSLPWEGLQGTDSFFPWPVGRRWRAFYGSARTETKPIGHWLVGPTEAETLAGPWRRVSKDNPAPLENRFIENPIVTEAPGGGFLVVYDSEGPDMVGWAYSADGVRWGAGQRLPSSRGLASGRRTCVRRSASCTKVAAASASSIPASSRLPTGRGCWTKRRGGRPAPWGSPSYGWSPRQSPALLLLVHRGRLDGSPRASVPVCVMGEGLAVGGDHTPLW